MTLTITLHVDNEAFVANGVGWETARILTEYAAGLPKWGLCDKALVDVNGNVVGSARFTG